ncbi:hypothetical protein PGB90_001370 [Kerria lacca]
MVSLKSFVPLQLLHSFPALKIIRGGKISPDAEAQANTVVLSFLEPIIVQ